MGDRRGHNSTVIARPIQFICRKEAPDVPFHGVFLAFFILIIVHLLVPFTPLWGHTGVRTGDRVGNRVGRAVGAFVGRVVGSLVGDRVGAVVGDLVGGLVGGLVSEARRTSISSMRIGPSVSI
jgi:uncharacterized membrane protein